MSLTKDEIVSLQRQLKEARANLQLIEERKSEFVMGTEVPLQLIKEERRLRERIAELETKLVISGQPPASPVSAETPPSQPRQPSDLAADVMSQTAVTDVQPRTALVVDPKPAETSPQDAPASSPKVNEVSSAEGSPESKDSVTEASPSATQSDGSDKGRLRPVKQEDQRRLLVLLGVAGFVVTAVIVWIVFAQLRCLLDYRITDGIVALLVFLAGGVAVAVSRLIAPTLYHRLLSLYGGIAAALILGILLALVAPPLSREVCYPAAPATELGEHQTRVRAIDGMTQVYVPGGTFQMGSTDQEIEQVIALCKQLSTECDENYYRIEAPLHTVTLSNFWLDQTEVTNAQYQLCVDSGQCIKSIFADDTHFNQGDHPVVGVSWYDALNYCTRVGAALPTEAQWEYAARGKERRAYPWGNDFDGKKLNFCDGTCAYEDNRYPLYDDGYAYTAPVTAFLNGVSWSGALNLSGNVWEWTNDWYSSYSPATQTDPVGPARSAGGPGKVIRGGSWTNGPLWARAARRGNPLPEESANYLGFRCVSNTVPLATPVARLPATPTVAAAPTSESTSSAPAIIEPGTGDRVPYKTHVRGTAGNLPADQQLWLLVQSYASPAYYPQSERISFVADGTWEGTAWIGQNAFTEAGRTFTLTLVAADAAASQTFTDAINKSLEQLPVGAHIVQVVPIKRTSPVISVTSHHTGDRVQGYEILQGHYDDLDPDIWQLYAMVSQGPNSFTPFGPSKLSASSGDWQIPVNFPQRPISSTVSFWLQPVLSDTPAAQRLAQSVGKTLTEADLAAQPLGLYERQAQTEVSRHERVAFASDRAGNDDVFIVNADGTDLQQLTIDPGVDSMPAWSPDGQEIAYISSSNNQWRLIIRTVNNAMSDTVPITVGSPSMPNWSPDGQWLAFQTWRGDNVDLYKVKRDGSAVTRLTTDGGRHDNPVWSPDGKRILYRFRSAQASDSESELYVMDADGGNVTRLTNDQVAEGYASWSPDGQRIIFVRDDGQNRDIYQMNADGSGLERLPSADYDDHPTFAPDGQRYVFDSSVNRDQILIGSTTGGAAIVITTGLTVNAEPAWSPDGERIAFTGRFNGDWDLYTMWEDGSDIRPLGDSYADAYTPTNEIEPRLSPDGHWVAFESDIDGDYEIWVEDAYSLSTWQRLTDNTAQDWHPSWSSDGSKIVFTSNRGGNLDIYVMNADGTGVIQLTNDPAHDDDPIWTADGLHIIFYSNRSGDGDLFMMDATDGRNVTPLVQGPGYDGQPAISPDDRVLIFASARDYGGTYATELYRLDLVSNTLTRLTNNGDFDSLPLWSASGDLLFFVSDRYYGIDDVWTMSPDGSRQTNLTQDHWDDTLGP